MKQDDSRDSQQGKGTENINEAQASSGNQNSPNTQNISNAAIAAKEEQLEKRIARGELWTIILTGAIAFFGLCSVIVGVLQWLAISGQLEEMRSSSKQTDKIVEAARKQAENTEKLAQAAIDQVGELKASVKATQLSANAARETLRPHLSIAEIKIETFEPNKPVVFFILWKNDGNSPTTVTKSLRWLGIQSEIPTDKSCPKGEDTTQPFVVAPHNTRPQSVETKKNQFSPTEIEDVRNGHKHFWFCGSVVYTSLDKEESFPLCSYLRYDMKLFWNCKK